MKSNAASSSGTGNQAGSSSDDSSSWGGFPGNPLSAPASWTVSAGKPSGTRAHSPTGGRQREAAPALAGHVMLPPVVEMGVDQALETLQDIAGLRSWLDAQEAKVVTWVGDLSTDRFADRPDLITTLTASEIAGALRIPERTAGCLVEHSELLTRHYPATLTALEDGRLSRRHAWAVVEEALSIPSTIPVNTAAGFEAELIYLASASTVAKFCHRARRLRELIHPESITLRHTQAVQERRVQLTPQRDGMSWLEAYLPTEQAAGIYHRIDACARGLQGREESRTLTQLRADVLTDVLTHTCHPASAPAGAGPGSGTGFQGIQPKVFVTVPVTTLLGGDTPGELEGYGPIDPETARKLAGHAKSFLRILTHPETGARLSFGRTRYKVPKDLKDAVRVRDRTCRHPGCNRLAVFSELDHTIPWAQGGETTYANIACLCKRHHLLKTDGYWHYRQPEPGTIIAISPAGRTYTTKPDPPPAPPPF